MRGQRLDRYGITVYATLSATWAVPLTLVKALAPLAAVLLWRAVGLGTLLDMVAACCVVVGAAWRRFNERVLAPGGEIRVVS